MFGIALSLALLASQQTLAVDEPAPTFIIQSQTAQAPGTVSIRGNAIQESHAAAYAHVSVRTQDGILLASGSTGSDGTFAIYGLPLGHYTLAVASQGVVVHRAILLTSGPLTLEINLPAPTTKSLSIARQLVALASPVSVPPNAAPLYFISDRHALQGTTVGTAFDPRDRAHPDDMVFGRIESNGAITPPPSEDLVGLLNMIKQTAIERGRSSAILVIVPGFNNEFSDGVAAAQAFVGDYAGSVVVFSWPSKHGVMIPVSHDPSSYFNDETDNDWARDDFRKFLYALAVSGIADTKNVSFVGHSMGNRLIADGFVWLRAVQEPPIPSHAFGQVITAAPDVDTDVYAQQAVPAITDLATRLTLYRASNDGALALSAVIHGHSRAGRDNSDFKISNSTGLEIIEASIFDCPSANHSYWLSSDTVHRDIEATLSGVSVNDPARAAHLAKISGLPNAYFFTNVPSGYDGQCGVGPENEPVEPPASQ